MVQPVNSDTAASRHNVPRSRDARPTTR
jgi:hypothetical protein